ncbi:hypothetical protein DAEQUDRAFT_162529 [Daedalea quercina L-15889]|uniref:Uncharacterized protein n=1 Tax=Daedalea quercina L-15889 TaxID=1314783 RepID=A0A165KJV2_9APHY|nr:hypothetical protein DAEQUDRAFT_162529 [Daedalea quercina L-15889]
MYYIPRTASTKTVWKRTADPMSSKRRCDLRLRVRWDCESRGSSGQTSMALRPISSVVFATVHLTSTTRRRGVSFALFRQLYTISFSPLHAALTCGHSTFELGMPGSSSPYIRSRGLIPVF